MTRKTIPQPGATRWSSLHRSLNAFFSLQQPLSKAVTAFFERGQPDIPGMDSFCAGWQPPRVDFLSNFNRLLESIARSLKYLEGTPIPFLPFLHFDLYLGQTYPTLSKVQVFASVLKLNCSKLMPSRDEVLYLFLIHAYSFQVDTREGPERDNETD